MAAAKTIISVAFSLFGVVLGGLLFWGMLIAPGYESGPLEEGWANQPGTDVAAMEEGYTSSLMSALNTAVREANLIVDYRLDGLDTDADATQYGNAKAHINGMVRMWSDSTPVPEGYEDATEAWLDALDDLYEMVKVIDDDPQAGIDAYDSAYGKMEEVYALLP